MTITAKEARNKIFEIKQKQEDFNLKYPNYVKIIDKKIEEAINILEHNC